MYGTRVDTAARAIVGGLAIVHKRCHHDAPYARSLIQYPCRTLTIRAYLEAQGCQLLDDSAEHQVQLTDGAHQHAEGNENHVERNTP